MKSIYIMLTRSETILSRLVYLVTRDAYTHASISFDENLTTFYSSSRKDGHTIFPAGPCREALNSGYYENHHHIPCAVYELKVENDAYKQPARRSLRLWQMQTTIISISLAFCYAVLGYHTIANIIFSVLNL